MYVCMYVYVYIHILVLKLHLKLMIYTHTLSSFVFSMAEHRSSNIIMSQMEKLEFREGKPLSFIKQIFLSICHVAMETNH